MFDYFRVRALCCISTKDGDEYAYQDLKVQYRAHGSVPCGDGPTLTAALEAAYECWVESLGQEYKKFSDDMDKAWADYLFSVAATFHNATDTNCIWFAAVDFDTRSLSALYKEKNDGAHV